MIATKSQNYIILIFNKKKAVTACFFLSSFFVVFLPTNQQ